MFTAVEGGQLLRNLGARIGFGGVIGLEKFDAFLVNPRQLGTDSTFNHCAVQRILCGLHRVGRAIVAIDAVHQPALTLRSGTFQTR